ncbi:uncharacterized protein B0H64DRAFT_463181 [Chaetomium fimeti]|uniref:Uncharacterized protein n=1 Tax=Chaetomium fimeti TaxID=1854472 RepID=A0AAE0LRA5_9PEZI|nr:hypothetical protein B0H64DRAFT_463181 [Chaetomium fimeti]
MLTSDEIAAHEAKGREVYAAMEAGVRAGAHTDLPTIDEGDHRYDLYEEPADPDFSETHIRLLESGGLPVEGYHCVEEGDAMLCWHNFAREDTLRENRPHWSDVGALEDDRKPQDNEIITLQAGEADFFSLLGTDNGKGIARMLGAYPWMFGGKIITSAKVTCTDPPNICWMLEEL